MNSNYCKLRAKIYSSMINKEVPQEQIKIKKEKEIKKEKKIENRKIKNVPKKNSLIDFIENLSETGLAIPKLKKLKKKIEEKIEEKNDLKKMRNLLNFDSETEKDNFIYNPFEICLEEEKNENMIFEEKKKAMIFEEVEKIEKHEIILEEEIKIEEKSKLSQKSMIEKNEKKSPEKTKKKKILFFQEKKITLNKLNIFDLNSFLEIDTQNNSVGFTCSKKTYTCKYCGELFKSGCAMGGHISKIHSGLSRKYKKKIFKTKFRKTEKERNKYFRDLFKY